MKKQFAITLLVVSMCSCIVPGSKPETIDTLKLDTVMCDSIKVDSVCVDSAMVDSVAVDTIK